MQRAIVTAAHAVSVQELTKDYGDVRAVDELTLEISGGEIFGLLGPNGSGKTTTINCLTGLQAPTKGKVVICGHDIRTETSKAREALGVSPQETAVYRHLTGRENVMLFGELYGVPKSALDARVDAVLEKVGLMDQADRRVGKYSGGMMRRVSIAIALVHDPSVILLDEPTIGMDPQARRSVWDYLAELKYRAKAILLTTHYMEEAEELCDRVGILDHGRLIAEGMPAELKERHRSRDLEGVFLELTGRRIRDGA